MKLKKFIMLLFLFLLPCLVTAHPHLFIKPSVQLHVENSVLKGIKINWEWDKWWSGDVIHECDFNNDGSFSEKEIKYIYKNFFKSISAYGYFIRIEINDKKVNVKSVKNFNAKLVNESRVDYNFYIPINKNINSRTKFEISFDDETIYTAFEKQIKLLEVEGYKITERRTLVAGYYGVKEIFYLEKK